MTASKREAQREARRALVLKLRAQGWTLQAIGNRLGVTKQAVQQLHRAATVGYQRSKAECIRLFRSQLYSVVAEGKRFRKHPPRKKNA